ncbi:hypothetical protein JRO89_XS01G0086100 [Xanthoceras sorbifolium]|uniref:Uncharacterized protein n=1 Tax=Xanthoceras sorbifolium TaxID=99658 RepID=A0ABQ8IIM2_9ROSI|nr:hypothetical protein JRO89_XS01G0086100 [Xanthoceras sorbifolium]
MVWCRSSYSLLASALRFSSSSIRFDIETKLVSPLPNKYCEASFVERLPFELQNLHQHGAMVVISPSLPKAVFTDVAVL